jgi:hypothetical protein
MRTLRIPAGENLGRAGRFKYRSQAQRITAEGSQRLQGSVLTMSSPIELENDYLPTH